MECLIDRCGRKRVGAKYCSTHLRWIREGRSLDDEIKPMPRGFDRKQCLVPGCTNLWSSNQWCQTCNRQWKKKGGPVAPKGRYRFFCIDANGYERWNKSHPDNIWGRQIYAHKAVMQLRLGRELLPEENVHHINGDRSDNRIENLELWNTSQPPGQRIEDKIVWAKRILELYGV